MNTPLVRALAWVAAGSWLASWFAPVIDGYPGWAAFRAAIQAPFLHTFPTAPEDGVPQVLSALTNVAFAFMFTMIIRNRISRVDRFVRVAFLCLVLNLYWLVQVIRADELPKLLWGYYLWVAAFALMTAIGIFSVVSGRRTSRTPRADTLP